MNFVNRTQSLSSLQFGFRRGLSTTDALILAVDNIYDVLNNGHHCLNMFIDLQKAFDTVNHKILLCIKPHPKEVEKMGHFLFNCRPVLLMTTLDVDWQNYRRLE